MLLVYSDEGMVDLSENQQTGMHHFNETISLNMSLFFSHEMRLDFGGEWP